MPSSNSASREIPGLASPCAVIVQWSYSGVCASTRTDPAGSVPSRPNSRRFESIMHAASTRSARSAANSARAASRSPPMWSPCSPTPMSKRRTATSAAGSRPAARSSDSGSKVACGESTAPVATMRPASSLTDRTGESARTTITERRSQSVSRMVTGVSGTPREAASRRARTQASGEFQATSTRPSTRSVTCRS